MQDQLAWFDIYLQEASSNHCDLVENIVLDQLQLRKETWFWFNCRDQFSKKLNSRHSKFFKIWMQELLLDNPVAQFIIPLTQWNKYRFDQLLLRLQQDPNSAQDLFNLLDDLCLLSYLLESIWKLTLEELA